MGRERPPKLNALLGRGAVYSGDMAFEGRVRLDGRFEGRIYTDDVLEIGELGRLEGEVDAARVIVAGTVDGKVRARGRLTVEATGCVKGEVVALEIDAAPGSRFSARMQIGTET